MTSKKVTYMIPFVIMLFGALVASSSFATPSSRNAIKKIVLEEAMNSIVPPALALAVAKVESDFNSAALSSAGARGVMQIMPATGRDEFGVEEDELWNARLNIQLGIDYLGQLYRQYGGRWDLALSHYNGGTLRGRGRYARPHSYTRKYVKSVKRWWRRYENQASVWMVASVDNSLRRENGWEPARTRVRNLLRESLKRYRKTIASTSRHSTNLSDEKNVKVLETPASRLKNEARYERNWLPRDDNRFRGNGFDENFYRRLERARIQLDDLGPPARWKLG